MKSALTKKSPSPLLLVLHGFTGDAYDFSKIYDDASIRVAWRFVELPGHFHDERPVPSIDEQWREFVSRIDQVMEEGKDRSSPVYFLAYSMGARLFLKALFENRWKPAGLILVGATGGLELESERSERLAHDRELAESIREHGIEAFIDSWMQQPMIASQRGMTSPERIRRKKTLQPDALAEALVEFSSGNLPSVWHRLSEIDCPTLLVAGEKDSKYRSLHERMLELIPGAEIQMVQGSGHAPYLEQPAVFREILIPRVGMV